MPDTDATQSQSAELVEINFNGRNVKVSSEDAEIIRQMEHDYKAGMNKKMEELAVQRRELESERTAVQSAIGGFEEDIRWLHEHADHPELFSQYELRSQGGRGFVGEEVAKSKSAEQFATDDTMRTNAQLRAYEERLKRLEAAQQSLIRQETTSAVELALEAKDAALKEGGFRVGGEMDELLRDKMELFHYKQNRPAKPNEVRQMFDQLKKLSTSPKPDVTKTPPTAKGKAEPGRPAGLPPVSPSLPGGKQPEKISSKDPNFREKLYQKALEYMGTRE